MRQGSPRRHCEKSWADGLNVTRPYIKNNLKGEKMFKEGETGTEEMIFEDSTEQTIENHDDSAVEEANEQSTSNAEKTEAESAESNTDSQTDDDIVEFLSKKGIDPSDPEAARKIAKMYRDVEKEFYKKSQEKAQLEREMTRNSVGDEAPADIKALAEVRAMKAELEANKWKQSVELTPEAEQKMVEYLSQPIADMNGDPLINPENGQIMTKGLLVINGQLSLDDVYKISGADTMKTDSIRSELKEEIKKEMAARQALKRPAMQSSDSSQFGEKEEDDPFLDGLLG